jgi:hypothetical protein
VTTTTAKSRSTERGRALLTLAALTTLTLALAALGAGTAEAVTYTPDCAGGPGCAAGQRLANWAGGLALFVLVTAMVAAGLAFAWARNQGMSHVQNGAAGVFIGALVGAVVVSDAAEIVNWGMGL